MAVSPYLSYRQFALKDDSAISVLTYAVELVKVKYTIVDHTNYNGANTRSRATQTALPWLSNASSPLTSQTEHGGQPHRSRRRRRAHAGRGHRQVQQTRSSASGASGTWRCKWMYKVDTRKLCDPQWASARGGTACCSVEPWCVPYGLRRPVLSESPCWEMEVVCSERTAHCLILWSTNLSARPLVRQVGLGRDSLLKDPSGGFPIPRCRIKEQWPDTMSGTMQGVFQLLEVLDATERVGVVHAWEFEGEYVDCVSKNPK